MEVWTRRKGKWVQLTKAEIKKREAAADRANARRVKKKGHDCWEHPDHSTFWNGRKMQDAYNCTICGNLLQVG